MPQIVSTTYYSLTTFESNQNNTKVACCCFWSALYQIYYKRCGVFVLKTHSACVIFLLCMAFDYIFSLLRINVFFRVPLFKWMNLNGIHITHNTRNSCVRVNKQRKSRLISAQFLRLLNGMSNNGKNRNKFLFFILGIKQSLLNWNKQFQWKYRNVKKATTTTNYLKEF